MAGRSPKRRRTDDVPSTISAERIAQTNATLEHITGQRHNRWMSGYVPPAQDGGIDDAANVSGRTASVQTGNGSAGVAGGESLGDGDTDLHVIVEPIVVDEEGTQAHAGSRENSAQIVAYETPTSDSSLTTTNGNVDRRSSLAPPPPGLPSPAPSDDHATSPSAHTATMPSDNTAAWRKRGGPRHSQQPTPVGSSRPPPPPNPPPNQQAPASRGPPQNNNRPPHPYFPPARQPQVHRGAPNGNRVPPQHVPFLPPRQQAQPPRGVPPNGNTRANVQPAAYSPPGWPTPFMQQNTGPAAQPVTPSPGPSLAAFYQQRFAPQSNAPHHNAQQIQMSSQAQSSHARRPSQPPPPSRHAPTSHSSNLLDPNVLQARIAEHEKKMSANNVSIYDRGRLNLLREAVGPRMDGFYIVLSQMHALADQPDQLAEEIRTLPAECFLRLDDLLSASKHLSAPTKKFLGEFPASIASIYTSNFSSAYSNKVNEVAVFLGNLPATWEALTTYCRKQQAPPLAVDLDIGLGLRSPVLQAVAFRSIVRMIWPNEPDIVDHVEYLHRRDQQSHTSRQHPRPEQEAMAMYNVYQMVRSAFLHWQQLKQNHEAHHQQRHPRTQPPPFQQFTLDGVKNIKGALALFDSNAPAPPSAPTAAPATGQQARPPMQQQQNIAPANPQQSGTPLQQQQAMVANAQRLGQPHAPNTLRVNTQSPAQFNMPQRTAPNAGSNLVPMPIQQHGPHPHLLFPHEHDPPRPQPTEPNPQRSALHLAYLRSPVSVALQIGGSTPLLYRSVHNYPLTPRPLKINMNRITFKMTDAEMARIPKTHPSAIEGELPNRAFQEGSQTYRMRVCKTKQGGCKDEKEWIESDTSWPKELYISLNGHSLQTRLPLHFKKNLPIDITSFVQLGENRIEAAVTKQSTDKSPFLFALAVETVGVVSHATIISNLDKKQKISVAEANAKIKKELGGTVDDDFEMLTQTKTIKLFDPYSGFKIFDTPVRGSTCMHQDCFDLETFLSQCTREKPGDPTAVDTWRCPICRADVRPSQLVKDEWLVGVREKLAKQGKLDTRAILVREDGSWKAIEEEKSGVRSASLEAEEQAKRSRSPVGSNLTANPISKKKQKPTREVITLD